MRQSTAHLVVAFCSTMAISAAPLSPLPPVSPALVSPMVIPRADAIQNMDRGDRESSVQEKRSVGGFAYHNSDNYGIYSRDIDESTQESGNEPRDTGIQSDSGDDSGFESESDFEANSVSEYDEEGAAGSDIEQRSEDSIMARSSTPSLKVTAENVNEDSTDPGPDDDQASIASVSDDEDSFSIASDEDFSAFASDDEDSGVTEDTPLSSQAASALNSPIDEKKEEKVEKRGIEIGSESDRHGGRYYTSETKWTA